MKSAGARETTRPGGHWGYRQGTFLADLEQPARTITASASQDWIRLADGSLRRLTLRECLGLQGFPFEWQLKGTVASRFRQVGNAVPVPVARAIGEALSAVLEVPGTCRPVSAPLPDDMLAAIEYTRREQGRNGRSRIEVRRRLHQGDGDLHSLKGARLRQWQLNRKCTDWSRSSLPILTVGVLAGFFNAIELIATIKKRGIPIFFEHDLAELTAYLRDGLYFGSNWNPSELFNDVAEKEVSAALEKMATTTTETPSPSEEP